MKKVILLTCCLLLILLAGCAADQLQKTVPSSTPAPPSPTPSKTSFWRIVTSTVTPTPTITPDVTPTPTYEVQQQCIDVSPEMPDDAISSGVVVALKNWEISLLDMTTHETKKITLSNEASSVFSLSPNRRFIAMENYIRDDEGNFASTELVIADAIGQRLKTIPWDENWAYHALGWLDNQQVVIAAPGDALESNEVFERWVINPFSGKQWKLELLNSTPDWDEFVGGLRTQALWPGFWSFSYDPTYTMSVYPRNIEGEDWKLTYNLWNITEDKLVISMESIIDTWEPINDFPVPDWSADGSHFVIEGIVWNYESPDIDVDSDLFRISRDGQIEQLTHFASLDQNIFVASPSWSPNERYVAFFMYTDHPRIPHLAILDMGTMQVTDYCITLNDRDVGFPHPKLPVWSPDSKQLLLIDNRYFETIRVILVDPEQRFATVIAEDADAIGWMAAPEE